MTGRVPGFECPPDHKHGETLTCYFHGCTCAPCGDKHNEVARRRRKLIAYGRWEPAAVPSESTFAKLEELRAADWTWDQIAEAAGRPRSTIHRLLANRTSTVFRSTRDAILSIGDQPPKRGSSRVDATGARRRLRGLAHAGHSWAVIGAAIGRSAQQVHALATSEHGCTAETAAAIADAYERLWDVPVPDGYGKSRAVGAAVRAGWHLPIEWAGLDIDDPNVEPEPLGTDRENDWTISEIDHLRELGESAEQVARQLGHNHISLARLARRRGRADMARWMGEKERKAA